MAAIRGNTGIVEFYRGDLAASPATTTIAEVTSYTVDTTQDTAEISSMGSTSREYISTMQSFSGSAEFILEGGSETPQYDAVTELDVFTNAEKAKISLYPEGNGYDGSPSTYGDIQIRGDVIITGMSITGSFDGVVTGSFTFQGTGDLAIGVTDAGGEAT